MDKYIYNLGLLFEKVVSENSSRTALQFPDGHTVSYSELNSRADMLARFLLGKGIKKNDVCAIAGVKRTLSYASMLACLKIGATYSFFDPESPEERMSRIFTQCDPVIVLGYKDEMNPEILALPYRFIDLNELEINTSSQGNKVDLSGVEGNTPAYIMFTSGSTGFPKGAVMTHANVINFIHWCKDTFRITTEDIHTNINPLYFDNSVFDMYASFFNGATIVPVSKKETLHPKLILDILEKYKCTTWFSVPSMLIYLQTSRAIIPEKWKYMKKIIFGGEGYPKARLVHLFNALHENTRLFNVYGPTECTCICSSYAIGEDDFKDLNGFLPLGKMAGNFSWTILDENRNITHDKGDLLLGGPNVGLGYYNDPERTAERFIQNPLHNNYRDIYYQTGDLVSFNKEDGKIYIHGRTDHQVKHMGYRIELEEIENAINQLDYINDAAAFVVGESNNNHIFAVYQSERSLTSDEIKSELTRFLPSYMMPREIIAVESIPKNANGKTDRPALTKKYNEWPK
jgi:D-alanine--poly(phosphoribitol) ligase subunit 1